MTEAQTALSRRLVACKGWRWMPGMATVQGERVVLMGDDGTLRLAAPWGGTDVTAVRSFVDSSGACLPDLTDPATLGCLLALVRAAWGMSGLSLTPWSDGWEYAWRGHDKGPCGYWFTEAEALVAALEGAP